MDTFGSLPELVCGHSHSDTEWKPRDLPDGSALCLLWLEPLGSSAWLCCASHPAYASYMLTLDSGVFCEWAMPAVAALLGLRIPFHGPVRVHVRDVSSRESGGPPDVIFPAVCKPQHGNAHFELDGMFFHTRLSSGICSTCVTMLHMASLPVWPIVALHVIAQLLSFVAGMHSQVSFIAHSPEVRLPRVGRVGRVTLSTMVWLRIPDSQCHKQR